MLHRCLLHESPPSKVGEVQLPGLLVLVELQRRLPTASPGAAGAQAGREKATDIEESLCLHCRARDTSPPALPLHLARPLAVSWPILSYLLSFPGLRPMAEGATPPSPSSARSALRAWRWRLFVQSEDVLATVRGRLPPASLHDLLQWKPKQMLGPEEDKGSGYSWCEPSCRRILRRSLLEAAAHLSVPVRQNGSLGRSKTQGLFVAMQLSILLLEPCYHVAFPEHLPQAPSRNNSKQRAEMPAPTPQQNTHMQSMSQLSASLVPWLPGGQKKAQRTVAKKERELEAAHSCQCSGTSVRYGLTLARGGFRNWQARLRLSVQSLP